MNPKLAKMRAEREKNSKRIAALQARNQVLDERITQMEDTDIIGMVRELSMSPEQLAALLSSLKSNPAAAMSGDISVPGIDPKEGCEDAMAALRAAEADDPEAPDDTEDSDEPDGDDTIASDDDPVALDMGTEGTWQ